MFEIRSAAESEAEALAQIGKKTFIETFAKYNTKENMELYLAQTFSPEMQLAEIRDPKRLIKIAWIQNTPAGFFHLIKSTPDPSVMGPNPIELLRIYVDSAWHGKGLGLTLMNECMMAAKKEGFRTLWLGVWEQNFRAQEFYKRSGFTFVGQHIFKLGADEQIDLIMCREI